MALPAPDPVADDDAVAVQPERDNSVNADVSRSTTGAAMGVTFRSRPMTARSVNIANVRTTSLDTNAHSISHPSSR